ncbi:MAG TPA: heterodisulfide reductase-related iron-sulfur binding cluster [Verrucomicrobiae bacterium]|jgi:glycolate oxidase iron-sulfur subunit|nr:heterodisulfide reductase-related iron-sulfur binding cluster [Verrucomicrobiae bacterium]
MNTDAPERFLDYNKSLACIHCGLCLSSCPTYLETGNENDSPRGRIYLMRAIQDGRLPLGDTAVRHLDLCLGCRACEAVCPSGVQYGDLLEHTRDHIEKHHRRSPWQTFLRRIAIEKVFPFPSRMKLALLPVKIIRALGLEKLLPKFARETMALVPEHPSATPLPEVSPATAPPKGRTGFISGCVMSVLFGDTNAASVRLLNRAGYEVVTPRGQGCCGALYAHSGQLEMARDCARHNIEVFERANLETIVINAAGCGSTLKEYGQLLRDDPKWAERAKQFSARVRDLTEVLAAAQVNSPPSSESSAAKVTYHDACHLAHPQHIIKPPRELIRALVGKNFVELPESDVCCGSAGSYNLTEPEMAARLQRRKIENILKTGAQIVVTTNPGCLLQIRAGLRAAGAPVEALHIADFLDRNR